MKKWLKEHGKYIWRLLFVFLLVLVSAIRVKAIEIPVTSSGEHPYWDLILRMAGQEGIVDISQTSYLVAFGYCLPFAVLIRNGISLLTVYKMAVFVNGLLWAVLYFMAAWICEKMTSSNLNSLKREGMMSLLCILPVFMAQSSAMGPQILLGVLTLATVDWVANRRDKSLLTKKEGITAFFIGICGMLISPLFAGVIIGIVAYFYFETDGFKEKRREWIILLVILCAGILIIEALEYLILLNMQTSPNEWNYSGLHSLFHMVAKGRRTTGLLGFVYGIIGKSMYLITNTYGLILVGLYAIGSKKKGVSSFGKVSGFVCFNVAFLLLAVHRTDISCGLPIDMTLSMIVMPILLVAAIALLEEKVCTKNILCITAIILIVGCLSRDVWELMEEVSVDWAATGMLALGRDFCRDVFENSILTASSAAILFLLIWLTYRYELTVREEKQGIFMKWYTGFFLFVMNAIIVVVSLMSVQYYVFDIINYAQDNIRFAYEIPGEYLENTDRPIMYYHTGSEEDSIAFARLLSMKNQKIIYTESLRNAIEQDERGILITKYQEEAPEEIINAYERVYGTNRLTVWERKGLDQKDTLKKALTDCEVKLVKVNSTDYTFVEYGKDYILPKGEYEIKVKLRITTNKTGKLGRVAVRTGAETLESKSIEGSGKCETKTIRVRVESAEDMTNFRVAIHKNRSVDVEEEWVYITKVGDADGKED